MSETVQLAPTTAVATQQSRMIEYVPFGAADKIKLSVQIVQKLVAVPTKSGKLPTERDAMRFLMLCQAQRLNPFTNDAYLVGYDGQSGAEFSLIIAHQALLKRADSSPDFLGMESGIIIRAEDGAIIERQTDFHLPTEVVVGGWAKVYHAKREKFPFYRRVRMERFCKGFAQWKVDAAGMISKCAEADALRSAFPNLIGGLYTAEESTPPIEATIARPLFKSPEKPAPVIEATVQSEPAQDFTQLRAAVSRLMTADGVTIGRVSDYLVSIGWSDVPIESVEAIPSESLQIVLDDWNKIKDGGAK